MSLGSGSLESRESQRLRKGDYAGSPEGRGTSVLALVGAPRPSDLPRFSFTATPAVYVIEPVQSEFTLYVPEVVRPVKTPPSTAGLFVRGMQPETSKRP